jgi:hypothetical protein
MINEGKMKTISMQVRMKVVTLGTAVFFIQCPPYPGYKTAASYKKILKS